MRDIIHRRICTGIIFHLEVIECQCKPEFTRGTVSRQECRDGLTLAEMKAAALGGKICCQCPCEDYKKRNMKEKYRETVLETCFQHIDKTC